MIGPCAAALAADDVLVTSAGLEGVRAEALDAGDVDVLLGQRVRWEVARGATLHLDGRFALDPDGAATWEDSRVRDAGVTVERPAATVLVGRAPLLHGGPRLVDGVQLAVHPDADRAWSVGAWAGLVPDEFTTVPLLRPGAGPLVAFERATASVSAAGEVVAGAEGLDRAGALVQARAQAGRAVRADTRADWLFADAEGRAGLVDGAAFVDLRPVDAVRLDLLYDAYSSLLYQSRAELDPGVQRFAVRVEEVGLAPNLGEDAIDLRLHHLLGTTVRVKRSRAGLRPEAALRGRGRLHPDPAEQYARVGPLLGLGGLLGDRLEVIADGNALWAEGRTQGDLGLTAILDVLPDAVATLDGSARVLLDPVAYAGRAGHYADLFVDVVAPSGTAVAAGASWTREPDEIVGTDVGLAAFLRIQQWFRPSGRAEHRVAADSPD